MTDQSNESSGLPGLAAELDLGKYDVESVADDLTALANLPKAIAGTAGRAALVPLAAFVVTWLLFNGRMPTWGLILFAVAAALLSLGVAAVVGVALFTRRQVAAVTDVSGRVLGVIGEMHADLAELRRGKLSLTVRETASTLSSGVVFPMIEDTIAGMAGGLLPGPLKRLAKPAVGPPLAVVRKSVTAAIDVLPLGLLDAQIELGENDDAGPEARLAAVEASVIALDKQYTDIQAKIEGFVQRAMKRAVAPGILAGVAATVPLVLWWALGWLLS